ncbi:TRCF domain-containing protein [Profundibacterium mesophilum]|uniref:Transcription-repair-coupling factor n=1 Tax=Profundibacterium mesophilum KAUST100406-0324 TaxID=1037889 RepID=A0A921NUT4_9RHOB|nr:TRCF domain-containing protein [Profundibacterium mesophilum]KAF0675895.1 Transcription-repair coupling factor [Profundibacterium mesophilum KAUST100406-0324]
MPTDHPAGAEAVRLLRALQGAGSERAIHLSRNDMRAGAIARFLGAALPGTRVLHFRPWDCLPYDWASPSAAAMGHRLSVLRRMAQEGPCLVITSPGAMAQRVPCAGDISWRQLTPGDALSPEDFMGWACDHGYRSDERVDEPGEIALRGAVVDIFPAAADGPFRIGFEDGAIETLRAYDAATQITTHAVETLVIDAASEMPPPMRRGGSLDDGAETPGEQDADAEKADPGTQGAPWRGAEHWLPQARDRLCRLHDHMKDAPILAGPGACARMEGLIEALPDQQAHRLEAEISGAEARRALPPDALYLAPDEWQRIAAWVHPLELDGIAPGAEIAGSRRPRAALAEAVEEAGRAILLAATKRDRARLGRMAAGAGPVREVDDWDAALALPDGEIASLCAPLERGFRDDACLVLTARDVLGTRAEDTGGATIVPPWLAEAQDLHLGDLVIHEDEGLGRFEGLTQIEGGEAIRICYAGDEASLVPVSDAGRLWRYGHDSGTVSLDKLGGKTWESRRARFAKTVERSAEALLAAATARRETKARKLSPPAKAYEKIAAAFAWTETQDQRRAIRAVLDDLASGTPMNRLLIGDVGFGKTEVAIRAAAAAALSGAQVALIAPTTVLARQHARVLARRFEGSGIEVAGLSRLSTAAEARRVREGLADGRIGIVAGTHAILGKGCAFHDLGLVVIDEEQRFGAKHKTALRDLAEGVHVLSMSATPIPRSLQGAIAGVQELSLLTTAPARRRPVRTVLSDRPRQAETLLRDALMREWRRGGQSFVVVPRVEDMEEERARLARLVPQLSIKVAHGKLPAREIDEVMTGFADGAGDVLLATVIIESGLDVPRANTMVVLRPELLGLAQLHQLRGRVGRGAEQAYCWLLTEASGGDAPVSAAPGDDAASDEEGMRAAARARLDAFAAADSLGAGFTLSVADMDQRGAGDLFGDAQSGHDARIGPALHAHMLAEALRKAKGEPPRARPDIGTEVAAALPADYIPRPEVRATLYNRLARASSAEEADRLADEVEDRFGPPPEEARNLLLLAAVRGRASTLGITHVSIGPKGVALDFHEDSVPRDAPEAMERSANRLILPGSASQIAGDDGSEAPLNRALEALRLLM